MQNDVFPVQRRSYISKYAIIGDTPIPPELGTTVTGAIANLYIPRSYTVYSAVNDTVTYIDAKGTHQVTTDSNGRAANVSVVGSASQPIVFTSNVARDTVNATNPYSKAIMITGSMSEIYVMPDKVIYWYGYHTHTFVNVTSANQYDTTVAPTYNTNNIYTYNAGGDAGHSRRSGFIARAVDVNNVSTIKTLRGDPTIENNPSLTTNVTSVTAGRYDITYQYRGQGATSNELHVYTQNTATTGYGGTQVASAINNTVKNYLYAMWME